MSGGHFNYEEHRLHDFIICLQEDPAFDRWPKSKILMAQLLDVVYEYLHKVDYDLSGDTQIKDDAVFDQQYVQRVKDLINKFENYLESRFN